MLKVISYPYEKISYNVNNSYWSVSQVCIEGCVMKISILSFSYKRGLPKDESGNGGGFVFDCRAIPNPFWDESLRGFSGCDKPVVEFFEQHKDKVDCFLDGVVKHLSSEYGFLWRELPNFPLSRNASIVLVAPTGDKVVKS